MSVITVSVSRNELKDWEAVLSGPGGSMSLYCGSSGNKAQDMAEELKPVFLNPVAARASRLDGKWCVLLGTVVVERFGSHANKAADYAEAVNKVLFPAPAPKLAAEE